MEKEIDVRLVEIIFLYPVDGELLFLVAQLFPFALCFGDILFGELCDAVEFIPEQVKLFVDGFLFLLVAIGNSHPFIVFDATNMQGGIVGVISIIPSVASSCMNLKAFPTDQWKMWLQSR